MSDEFEWDNQASYREVSESRIRADRMAAGLASLVGPVAGDLSTVLQLRARLAQVTKERDRADLAAAQWEFAWEDTYAKAQTLQAQLAQARTWMLTRLKESAHLMHTQACAIQSRKTGFALSRCTCGLREWLADLPEAPVKGEP
jgi:hypothetical protein